MYRFIDDEAEEASIVVDSRSEDDEKEIYERDGSIFVDNELFRSSNEPRRWSLVSNFIESKS